MKQVRENLFFLAKRQGKFGQKVCRCWKMKLLVATDTQLKAVSSLGSSLGCPCYGLLLPLYRSLCCFPVSTEGIRFN